MENKYRGIVFIPRTTGEAIINAYAMNAWNEMIQGNTYILQKLEYL